MKVTKSQLKELIRQAIVEDIMDKEIKNAKTGNMIKVRTALQLPDEHPANKKAKDMVAKSGISKDSGEKQEPEKETKPSSKIKSDPFDDKEKSSDEPKERPKSMRDLDWDNELEPYEIEGWVQDNKSSIPNRVQFSLNKLIDKHGDAYADAEATGDYDKANQIQKQIDQLLTKSMDKSSSRKIDRKELVGKQDDVAKSMGAEHTADILKRGTADKIQDFVDAIDDKGQDFKKIDKLTNSLRDNPDDMKTRQAIFKLLTLKESKKRRYTVKEVRMWMKKLEENRYKKVYNSDARRVAWLANNNLSEDYESMPISMRKKWSKAAYGRERYLAKEFLKSKLDQLKEQLEEQKLKESIKKIVFRMLNEGGPGSGPHKDDEDNPFDKEPTDDELADIEKEFEGVKKEGKLNETLPALAKEYTQYQKAEKLYIQSIRKLAMKAGRVEKVYDKQIMHSLKVFLGKGMNQFQNAVKDVLDKLQ